VEDIFIELIELGLCEARQLKESTLSIGLPQNVGSAPANTTFY
jgi:hypothetical protein